MISDNRDRVMKELGDRHAPLAVVIALEHAMGVDNRRRVWISGDGDLRIRVRAWFDVCEEDAKIVALLIAAGFIPDGVSTILSGVWTWGDGKPDERQKEILDFVTTELIRRKVRVHKDLEEAARLEIDQ